MRISTTEALWLSEVASTQDFIAGHVQKGDRGQPIVMAGSQTKGRGRFGREWMDESGQSLLVSLALWDYPDHPAPWLLGMGIAVAVASALTTQIRWPNDLTISGLKVGGVLTELVINDLGQKVPVVGIGVNLSQAAFPPLISETATSLKLARGTAWTPSDAWSEVHCAIHDFPEPKSWADLAPVWELFDDTPSKCYRLHDGRIAVALGIGPEGQLIGSVDGETVSVYAADAHFGALA